jgi:heme oxygenase
MPDVHAISAPAPPAEPSHSTGPASGIDALQQLRAATRAIHDRLDSRLPLARDGATLADYGRHLQAIAGWLRALEPAWRVPGSDPAWAARNAQRLRWIADDLHDCGLAPAPSGDAAGAASPPTQADAAAFAWGLAYVVEGSQLGGQMLHRALAPRFAPHPLRYLRGAGNADAWRDFMIGLRAAVATPAQAQAATDGALAGFQALVRRFEAAGDLR